jgi:hypothetical protein
VDLYFCLQMCADDACVDQCAMDHQTGVPLYNDMLDCVFCQECTTSCSIDPAACPASCDNNMGDCDSCQTCTLDAAGSCDDDFAICMNNPDCVSLLDCLTNCVGAACDMCPSQNPNGVQDYVATALCVICQECPMSCDAVGSGCP